MAKITTSKTPNSNAPKPKKPVVKRSKDHDNFVRGILSINSLVLKLLLHYIPKNMHPFIDFSTLKILSDVQINRKLKYTQADSIHECHLNVDQLPESARNEKQLPLFRFCFLWEHKSSKPEEPIECQIEPYRYGIIRTDLRNQLSPSLVIPILFYHGVEKWDKKMIYEQYAPFLPPDVLVWIPYPRYILIDIQAMSEAEIEAATDLEELRAAFIALKYSHDKVFFKQGIKKVLKFVDESKTEYLFQEFFKMLFSYMQLRGEFEEEEFNNLINQNSEEMGNKAFKNVFELAEERGEARGFALAMRISHLVRTTVLTDVQIAKELATDEAYVKMVREELKATQQ